jgi:hypothetical protein
VWPITISAIQDRFLSDVAFWSRPLEANDRVN